jgi:hypothetical protein
MEIKVVYRSRANAKNSDRTVTDVLLYLMFDRSGGPFHN